MDSYCHLLLEKLAIPKSQWNEYIKKADETTLKIDRGVKYAAYLGTPSVLHEGVFLSKGLRDELAALDIQPTALAYIRGLASVRTCDEGRLSLLSVEESINGRIEQMLSDTVCSNWLGQLILAAKLLQLLLNQHLYIPNKGPDLKLLLEEQDRTLAQIACYCLPVDFLQKIRNPVPFVEQVAPKLGRYILTKLVEDS